MWRSVALLVMACSLSLAGSAQAAPRTVVGELFSTDN